MTLEAAAPAPANHLRALRAEKNWSQKELSRRLGVSRRTICAIENGRYVPSVALALHIAAVLDRQVDAVFRA
jgi:putative transcriptional regulator